MNSKTFLSMEHISKAFYGVPALKDVQLQVKAGEVRALLGENGAGKSTLMKILAGLYTADAGEILIESEKVAINNPLDARKKGVNFIHQEICLAGNMTIAENLYLGVEQSKKLFLDKKAMMELTQKHLNELGLNLKAEDKINSLSLAQQQMVEIARALFFDAKLVVMDEPTSSLTNKEVESLFEQIEKLKSKNVAVIYISHRMEEIFKIADSVTVLRDGTYIGTKQMNEVSRESLIAMMVGRKIEETKKSDRLVGGEVIFQVKNLKNKHLNDVSFDLKKGEVLCFAGLIGAGRTEMATAIYGIDRLDEGEILLEGKKIENKTVQDSIANGIALIPEDRKKFGLVTILNVKFNLTLAVLARFIKGIVVDKKKELSIVEEYSNKLSIKMSGPEQVCAGLSGGNQQKVVISKWLTANPKIIIMDEPTRGIDVGAKAEIYELITRLAQSGIGIIVISSELPEVIRLASRVAVMHEGKIQAIIDATKEEVTQEKIMHFATGGN